MTNDDALAGTEAREAGQERLSRRPPSEGTRRNVAARNGANFGQRVHGTVMWVSEDTGVSGESLRIRGYCPARGIQMLPEVTSC